MPDILLVPGSCHGAWCWRDLIPALAEQGHIARAINLPLSGEDGSEVTLDDYADSILTDIENHGGHPVVLLGHSAGGYAITAAAERSPEKVAALFYLCAYVPEDGKSLADLRRAAAEQPVLELIERAETPSAFRFKSDRGVEALCHDCPEEVSAFVRANLGPQPIAPQETPLTITDASLRILRHYILCTKDRVIPPAEQRRMSASFSKEQVMALETGHAPYFAAPETVAAMISTALA
ncbi:alpha/beta fold hydrolase [Celeribacter litoreus]|uniref:alpha/beta fold hydrolase n=1 Tax=Celeribacter litoreus TaxID=2876714 RepID=UPI001CCABF49|nr:alpha/beta fold hydrolase [Celeribacter litoreus]MCA0044160.1 alpha/beta fold hydrolase [Celeribacter litoreus]